MINATFWLILAASLASGLLAGASLDQSIKQLPSRHRVGVMAYSAYTRAADLGPGILWYSVLGVLAALLTISAALSAWMQKAPFRSALPLYAAAVLAVLHSLATSQAAPMNVQPTTGGRR